MAQGILVGVTGDFLTDAKGRFERHLEAKLNATPWEMMPTPPGNRATPELLDRYDAILSLGLKIDESSVAGVERFGLVARWGVGYDMIDTEALTRAGVALAITPGAVRRPVAEAILTFIFALTTNLLLQDRLVRAGGWRGQLPKLGHNLPGRTLGSLGCGNIAQELFRKSRSLGFGRMIAHDPFVSADVASELGVELVGMEELFAQSDFLSISTPLNAQTRGMVNDRWLRKMKPDAYLINTARGPIVDEAALIRVLREGRIAGAGLDVFETEPLPDGSPLREMDNVILAPHGLAWTEETARDNTLEACGNILSFLGGTAPASVVNKDVLKSETFEAKLRRSR